MADSVKQTFIGQHQQLVTCSLDKLGKFKLQKQNINIDYIHSLFKQLDMLDQDDKTSILNNLTIIAHLNSNIIEFSSMVLGLDSIKVCTIVPPKIPVVEWQEFEIEKANHIA